MNKRWIITSTILYLLLCAVVFPYMIGVPYELTFTADADLYSKGAVSLLEHGMYSIDNGEHPFMDREPGQSFFLAPIFAVAGYNNAVALYIVQAGLLFLAAWALCTQLSRRFGNRTAVIAFLLLLTSGATFHVIFSAYREALLLSLLMFFAALELSSISRPWKYPLLGAILGAVILTSFSFVLLPIGIAIYLFLEQRSKTKIIALLAVCYVLVVAWAGRNYLHDGRFRVIDNHRPSVMWYIRGEQAERIHGLEPFWCLWAEYISRDWSGRSESCSFNAVMHREWPNGFDLSEDFSHYAREGQVKIVAHPLSYLWFSVFEIIELHLPFVGGGWSHAHNLYIIATMMIMYFGCVLALSRLADRNFRLILLIAVYNMLVYILTDATPRYLVPVLFCYAVLAALGYNSALRIVRHDHE